MKIYIVHLFLLFLFLFFVGCDTTTEPQNQDPPPPPTPTYGNLKGVVKSVSTNTPISGVVVSCGGITATTLADGLYQLNNITTGQQTLTATKSGYENYSTSVNITTGTLSRDIQLTTSISQTSLSGTVRDAETNQPLSGVKVTVAGMIDYTDASGNYQLPTVPQGQQTVTAEFNNYDNFSGITYLGSGNKVYDIVMTWKMPKIISASGSYMNLGNPSAPTGYTLGQDVIDNIFRHSVSITVQAHDAKGISKVEVKYYQFVYQLGKIGSGTVIHILSYVIGAPTPVQNLNFVSSDTYSANFYVGNQVAPTGPGYYYVLSTRGKPTITVTDTDGNITTQQINW